jgi:uncharacterized membrane protein
MAHVFGHLRTYVVRGMIAIIPIGLSLFLIHFLYVTIDRRVAGYVANLIGFRIPGLGIVLVALLLYLTGLITSHVAGRQLLRLVEGVTRRIPLVRTTYNVGKQLGAALSLPESRIFKQPVLVEHLRPGVWTVGFVTGTLTDAENPDEVLFRVFIPTPPNPTSGFLLIVKKSQTKDPGWTVEEALKAVISAGILSPSTIRLG